MPHTRTYCKLVSLLLQYPDDNYLRELPEIVAATEQLPRGQERAAIEAFLADLKEHSILHLQERYTAAFDLSPSTTLNMTYHHWGDGEKRAAALVALHRIYRDAGYDIDSGELPDYLPLVLEFLATGPDPLRSDPIQRCLANLDTIVDRLRPIAAPYAELLTPLAAAFSEKTDMLSAGSNG